MCGNDKSSLRHLSLGLIVFLGFAAVRGALRLDVFVIDSKSLIDLGLKGTLVLNPV
jgi:hypothetical protein